MMNEKDRFAGPDLFALHAKRPFAKCRRQESRADASRQCDCAKAAVFIHLLIIYIIIRSRQISVKDLSTINILVLMIYMGLAMKMFFHL